MCLELAVSSTYTSLQSLKGEARFVSAEFMNSEPIIATVSQGLKPLVDRFRVDFSPRFWANIWPLVGSNTFESLKNNSLTL